MKESAYKSYDELPLFLNAEKGTHMNPSNADSYGKGGAAE